jgi:hypothetical protein
MKPTLLQQLHFLNEHIVSKVQPSTIQVFRNRRIYSAGSAKESAE